MKLLRKLSLLVGLISLSQRPTVGDKQKQDKTSGKSGGKAGEDAPYMSVLQDAEQAFKELMVNLDRSHNIDELEKEEFKAMLKTVDRSVKNYQEKLDKIDLLKDEYLERLKGLQDLKLEMQEMERKLMSETIDCEKYKFELRNCQADYDDSVEEFNQCDKKMTSLKTKLDQVKQEVERCEKQSVNEGTLKEEVIKQEEEIKKLKIQLGQCRDNEKYNMDERKTLKNQVSSMTKDVLSMRTLYEDEMKKNTQCQKNLDEVRNLMVHSVIKEDPKSQAGTQKSSTEDSKNEPETQKSSTSCEDRINWQRDVNSALREENRKLTDNLKKLSETKLEKIKELEKEVEDLQRKGPDGNFIGELQENLKDSKKEAQHCQSSLLHQKQLYEELQIQYNGAVKSISHWQAELRECKNEKKVLGKENGKSLETGETKGVEVEESKKQGDPKEELEMCNKDQKTNEERVKRLKEKFKICEREQKMERAKCKSELNQLKKSDMINNDMMHKEREERRKDYAFHKQQMDEIREEKSKLEELIKTEREHCETSDNGRVRTIENLRHEFAEEKKRNEELQKSLEECKKKCTGKKNDLADNAGVCTKELKEMREKYEKTKNECDKLKESKIQLALSGNNCDCKEIDKLLTAGRKCNEELKQCEKSKSAKDKGGKPSVPLEDELSNCKATLELVREKHETLQTLHKNLTQAHEELQEEYDDAEDEYEECLKENKELDFMNRGLKMVREKMEETHGDEKQKLETRNDQAIQRERDSVFYYYTSTIFFIILLIYNIVTFIQRRMSEETKASQAARAADKEKKALKKNR